MARSLEGKKFFFTGNNGVTALISEEIRSNRERAHLIQQTLSENELRHGGLIVPDPFSMAINEGLRHISEFPIFTFVNSERLSNQPWFTGNTSLFEILVTHIRDEGGEVEGKGFNVPFSNAYELGLHGFEAMRSELKYVTTEGQFRETFGIDRRELEERYREKSDAEIQALKKAYMP